MSYLQIMVDSYTETALWSSHNDLYETSMCLACDERVKLIRNSTWGSLQTEEVTRCPKTDNGLHYVPRPEKHSEMLNGDYDEGDIAESTMAEIRSDCDSFRRAAGEDLDEIDAVMAGHDFWLTRNGHGAGFWDRGLGEVGDRLTKLAKPYGEYNLYVGDDGKIHGS